MRVVDVQFRQEKDLVETLKPSVGVLLRKSIECAPKTNKVRRPKPIVLEQVCVGMTIPDLLVVNRVTEKYINQTRPTAISHFDSSVLAMLHEEGPSCSETLAEVLFSRATTVISALERLERSGAVRKIETGEFSLAIEAFPSDLQIISIEAKLRHWREAVAQAKSYLAFSDYSYIALPARLVQRNDLIAATCQEEGIGLISVSPRSKQIVMHAKLNTYFSHDRFWLLSRIGEAER